MDSCTRILKISLHVQKKFTLSLIAKRGRPMEEKEMELMKKKPVATKQKSNKQNTHIGVWGRKPHIGV